MIQQKIKEEQEKEEESRRKRERLLNEYNSNLKDIKEANEICKALGKRIKFKQCII